MRHISSPAKGHAQEEYQSPCEALFLSQAHHFVDSRPRRLCSCPRSRLFPTVDVCPGGSHDYKETIAELQGGSLATASVFSPSYFQLSYEHSGTNNRRGCCPPTSRKRGTVDKFTSRSRNVRPGPQHHPKPRFTTRRVNEIPIPVLNIVIDRSRSSTRGPCPSSLAIPGLGAKTILSSLDGFSTGIFFPQPTIPPSPHGADLDASRSFAQLERNDRERGEKGWIAAERAEETAAPAGDRGTPKPPD